MPNTVGGLVAFTFPLADVYLITICRVNARIPVRFMIVGLQTGYKSAKM